MQETAILSNQREATRLYERGVAAARSGQRRVAAGLLQRAVLLNPQHEGAWLWLAGVLDDPNDALYCLRSVLAINPMNERARSGIAWIEQRQAVGAPTGVTQRLPVLSLDQIEEPASTRQVRAQGESWWVNWRSSRRAMNRARIIFWLVPIILLSLTLAWRHSVVTTVARVQAELRPTVVATSVPIAIAAGPAPTPTPHPPSRPRVSDDATMLAYLSQIEPLRAQLRDAVEVYRQAVRSPGGSSIQHSAAARELRAKVENAHQTLSKLTPPQHIADLHQEYLNGLAVELQALDDLIAFYGEYTVAHANRAALRFQESSAYFARAQAGFDRRLSEIERLSEGPQTYSPR